MFPEQLAWHRRRALAVAGARELRLHCVCVALRLRASLHRVELF